MCYKIHIADKADERHLVKSLTLDEEKAYNPLTKTQIIQPPLEIIKDCHIYEDKW